MKDGKRRLCGERRPLYTFDVAAETSNGLISTVRQVSNKMCSREVSVRNALLLRFILQSDSDGRQGNLQSVTLIEKTIFVGLENYLEGNWGRGSGILTS